MKEIKYLFTATSAYSLLWILILVTGCTRLLSQVPNGKEDLIGFRIDSLVEQHETRNLFSGAIMITQGDRVLFNRPYGYANWELRVPNSPSTRFGIASITKSFTDIVISLLIVEGKINMKDPVEKYLIGFPKGPQGGIPTIEHLLYHRAGVPHRVTNECDETKTIYPTEIVERVKSAGLLFEPGTQRQYSSAGYTCLARVIEIIENRSFDATIQERIFKPANMSTAINETGQRLMPGRSNPYRLGSGDTNIIVVATPYKDLHFLTGAGSAYATVGDMIHFIDAIKSSVFGDTRWKETFGEDTLSWSGFAGRTNGYESFVDVLPSKKIAFVLLSNLQSASNWQLREQIQGILNDVDLKSFGFPPPVVGQFEDPKTIVGLYGSAEILLIDGKLFRGENEFYPTENYMYYIPASGNKMRFRRNNMNQIDALINIRPDGSENILLRIK